MVVGYTEECGSYKKDKNRFEFQSIIYSFFKLIK